MFATLGRQQMPPPPPCLVFQKLRQMLTVSKQFFGELNAWLFFLIIFKGVCSHEILLLLKGRQSLLTPGTEDACLNAHKL